jgi:hypothetical protein
MWIMGLASLLQVTLLPGIIVTSLLKTTDGIIKTLLLSFSVSLLTNHYLVILLTALGQYDSNTLYILFALEFVTAVWLTRGLLKAPLSDLCKELKSGLKAPTNNSRVILFFAAVALCYFTVQLLSNAGSVIDGWDPLFSWNRWAVDWYHGRFPNRTWHYPQLLPSNWSITYLFIGTSKVEFFATAIMPLFPLFSLLALFDLWRRKKEPAYGYAIPALAIIYLTFLFNEMNQGYADFAVAHMSFVPIYVLLLLDRDETDTSTFKHLFLGLICCAGAALTKQAALYLVGIYPILFICRMNQLGKRRKAHLAVASYGFLAVSVAPWYLFVNDRIKRGLEESEIPYVTKEIYHGADLGARCINSLSTITKDITVNLTTFLPLERFRESPVLSVPIVMGLLLLIYLLFLGARDKFLRQLLFLFIIPYYVIWSLYFSYGIRNLAIILPMIALVAGYGCTKIGSTTMGNVDI